MVISRLKKEASDVFQDHLKEEILKKVEAFWVNYFKDRKKVKITRSQDVPEVLFEFKVEDMI